MTELHLHIDGSIRPETAFEIGKAMQLITPDETLEHVIDKMTVPWDCDSLNTYLERFELPLQLVQDRVALERMTRELVIDLADEGVHHAELRFAPHSSIGHGLTQRDACDAVLNGALAGMAERPGIEAGIILCCMRGISTEANMETIRLARDYKGSRIVAADLAGAEAIFPTHDYTDLFHEARRLGVPFTVHAGEADGPESMRAALSTGTKRIGHGVRAVEDDELIRQLVREEVTLEVCLTSNHQTCICEKLSEHPIRRLFDAGVRVTLSSDNRTISGTTLSREIEIAQSELGFTIDELAQMEQWAQEALFR